jgi:hypothetical protein
MYPKNAAAPEPIAIGAVIQITDGAVQTTGCTVRIKPIGVAEGDGAGTTAYSTDGIVLYTPTQAETNYTSFILIAKKTGCIPVALTIVTTSSATPGTVLLAPVTHTSAVVPTVTTLTGHTAQTGDSFARIGATGSGLTSLSTQTSVDALGGSSAVTVERSISDTKAITFAWPVSGATITGTRSIDNADPYVAVAGAIASLRDESGKYYYTLAYNVADRPTAEGQVRYKFVDGLYTRYVVLRTATSGLDASTRVKLDATQPDYAPATAAALATVQSDTNDIQTRLPAALESGRIAAVLDSATSLKINRIEAVVTGTVTGAGTSTEVFVGPSATLTITVDASGNRSAVVVT